MVFCDQHTLSGPNDLQGAGVYLPDKEGCAVTHDMIGVGTLTRIDQEQSIANGYPVLLGVIAA